MGNEVIQANCADGKCSTKPTAYNKESRSNTSKYKSIVFLYISFKYYFKPIKQRYLIMM